MQVEKCSELLFRLRDPHDDAVALRLPDRPLCGTVHGPPKRLQAGSQVEPVPLGPFHDGEPVIDERYVVVHATQGDRAHVRQQTVAQEPP